MVLFTMEEYIKMLQSRNAGRPFGFPSSCSSESKNLGTNAALSYLFNIQEIAKLSLVTDL